MLIETSNSSGESRPSGSFSPDGLLVKPFCLWHIREICSLKNRQLLALILAHKGA
ncbi:hypothetical protein V1291_004153 [Nitrobacteraceae bacterium AZCC 1564]